MAKKPTQLSNQFRFSASPVALNNTYSRSPIKLLPPVHQTDTLTKFFGATADHLFSKGKSRQMKGYIGHHVSYEKSYDTYVNDGDSKRDFYQLEPTMVSKTETGETVATLFYDDLINKLRFQGAIVDDHNRMFSQNYYSWSPYINLDKFINFREYFWVPEGSRTIEVYGNASVYVGDDVTQMFPLTNTVPFPASADDVAVTVDKIPVPFTYSNGNVFLTPPPSKGADVRAYTAASIAAISGLTEYTFTNSVKLTNGLRIHLNNDTDKNVVGNYYIIEGVGDSIVFVEDNNPDLTLSTDYTTIARGGSDGNEWSRDNRWFHKSLIVEGTGEQARRPIVEFNRNIKLFNYGTTRRNAVDIVAHSVQNFYNSINGRTVSSVKFDGVEISKTYIESKGGEIFVLVTGETRPEVNNRKYRVYINNQGTMAISLYADGEDPSGYPVVGEMIEVKSGATYGGSDLYWNGENWVIAQKKRSDNQFPLFALFDENSVQLDDSISYPASTFKGSRLFGYDTSGTTVDPVLGFTVKHSEKGELQFANYLATETFSYKIGVTEYEITDNLYFAVTGKNGVEMKNGWNAVAHPSRQWVVDTFVASKGKKMFTLSQEPADENSIQVFKNSVLQKEGRDYIRQYANILMIDLTDGDRVVGRTFNPLKKAKDTPGFYEIPLNLSANPAWEKVTTASQGDLHIQFADIIKNQPAFSGMEYSSNNYRDLKIDYSLGGSILSHSAPLLATMLMASSEDIDFINTSRFSEREYARFRGKFDKKIRDFIISNKFANADISVWVDAAIAEINVGLTGSFAFADSEVARTTAAKTFIPATPSWIGGYPIQEPSIYTDPVTSETFIIGHDGTYFPLYKDMRDQAVLELEKRIYASAKDFIKENVVGYVKHNDLVSTRTTKGLYTQAEDLTILRPMFEKWCVNQNVRYKEHKYFVTDDPFTWNYSSVNDIDGNPAPGHWRGIFVRFYGTDRPHTNPWEMIGFTVKPTWWEETYGTAPYTADNKILWDDISTGTIAAGDNAGVYENLAKPIVINHCPVDDQGKIRTPVEIGLVTTPSYDRQQDEWKFGDYGPAEMAWRKSYWFPFSRVQASYLMTPSVVIESLWDVSRQTTTGSTRGAGYPYFNQLVYGERTTDGSMYQPVGIQQWVYDSVSSKNKNITEYFGKKIRGLGVNLAYKVAGFTDKNNLTITSDVIQTIPAENINVELYTSPSVREEFTGGVIVQNIGNGWKVFGYDILDPVFKVIPPDYYGGSTNVSVESTQKKITPDWLANTYYQRGVTVRHSGAYYSAIRSHTSANSFEAEFWQNVKRPAYADEYSVPFYNKPNTANAIERVVYGSVMKTPLDVSVFLSGHQNYLESRGFKFNEVNPETLEIVNWRTMLRKFMAWTASGNVQEGDFIVLFPTTDFIKFETDFGNIRSVEQLTNGVYSILDVNGFPIQPEYTHVVRNKGELTVSPVGDQIPYSLRVSINEIEHVIIIDNETIFGDRVYYPLYNSRQDRLMVEGYKTDNWKGRIDAPGFIVTGNIIRPNFEKTEEMIRNMFEVENFEPMTLMERARANIGYYDKLYMKDLRVTGTNQFEFFKGMVQQKGTHSALNKLFRSSYVSSNSNTEFLEEWAFRIGDYGYASSRPSMDFMLKQGDFTNDPQLFEFSMTGQGGWDMPSGWDNDHWDGITRSQQTITRHISVRGLADIRLTSKGSGYKSTPRVEFSGNEDNAMSATATLDWSKSGVASVSIKKGGTGYFEGDQVIFAGAGNGAQAIVSKINYGSSKVKNIELVGGKAGTGYKVGDTFKVELGSGARGKVTEVDADGAITAISMTSAGMGYSAAAYVTFTGFNQTASEFMRVTVTGGAVSEIRVISAGMGYDFNTGASVLGTGNGAECAVNVTGADVALITINNPGGGLSEAPTVTLVGGDPTETATAVATIDETALENGTINLLSFLRPEAISLKRLIIKVGSSFNGVQPLLSIGDANDPKRYAGPYFLSTVDTHVIEFNSQDVITNAEKDINIYVTNAADSGNVSVICDFAYTPAYYSELFNETTDSSQSVRIVDLFENGQFEQRNSRWINRYETELPDWPTKKYGLFEKGNLPNAGYVHLDDIHWTAKSYDEFLDLYYTKKEENPSTEISNKMSISYESEVKGVTRHKLVGDLTNGLYKVKTFIIDVMQAFSLTTDGEQEVSLSIGTIKEPEKFVKATEINLDRIYTSEMIVFDFVTAQDVDSEIYAFVEQKSGLFAAPGMLTIETSMELMGNSVIPGQNAWCYDSGNGRWDVYRFANTSANVLRTKGPSYEGQGTIVAADRNLFEAMGISHNWFEPRGDETNNGEPVDINPTFYSDISDLESRLSKTVIDGTSNSTLSGVYKAKIGNSVRTYINSADYLAGSTASINTVKVMDVLGASNLVINKITASVVRPFVTPDNSNPTLTIGTIKDPRRFIGSVDTTENSRFVLPAPSRPDFSYAKPQTIDVYDTQMSIYESEEVAKLRFVRSGNLFVTPTAIKVINGGYGYAETSNPKVTVTGPTGVSATAIIKGRIVGFNIVNGGAEYETAPNITFMGGNGTGAEATTEISLGKVVKVNIVGAGTGSTATASVAGGKVTGVSFTAGTGWKKAPIVVFSGGGASSHAVATATLDANGGIAEIKIDNGGSGYTSVPTVTLLASTGQDYLSAPTVIVAGGNGYGAVIEPIMQWYVASVNIINWGKCSWTGENGSVEIEAPVNGGAGVGELEFEPATLSPSSVKQMRWRVISPDSVPTVGLWNYQDIDLTFPVPSANTSPAYWIQTVNFELPEIDVNTVFQFELPEYIIDPETEEATADKNFTNAAMGTSLTSTVTVYNNVAGESDINLKIAGTPKTFFINDRLYEDDQITMFFNPDGVEDGLITIEIDYHYLNGFEAYEQAGNPAITTGTGIGGDIFAWNNVRFDSVYDLDNGKNVPVDNWLNGTKIWLDDGRTKEEVGREWEQDKIYQYHDMAIVDGNSYRSIKGGSGLTATVNVSQGSVGTATLSGTTNLYTADPKVTVHGVSEDGTPAEGYVLLLGTSVYKILVKNPETNSGYTGKETIKIEPKHNRGSGASAIISKMADNGAIQEITVVNGGINYDATPIVTIENDTSANPVEFDVVLVPARPRALLWSNRGSGYEPDSTYVTFETISPNTAEFVPAEWESVEPSEKLWSVYERNNGWEKLRIETPKINASFIESAQIYNVDTEENIQTLQVFDPYKGFIPGIVKKELTYLLEYDPAVYNTGPKAVKNSTGYWDGVQVGQLWWDINTVRYLDYEIADIDYKWKHWGKLAPGITVDIYEWVRSTVHPNQWDDYVADNTNVVFPEGEHKPSGSVMENTSYVIRSEFDVISGRNITAYYFWVKNPWTLPLTKEREFSAYQLSEALANPHNADFPWFAVVEPNKLMVGGTKRFVNDTNTAINIKWLTTINEGNHHKQWVLVREKDTRNSVDGRLWDRMIDSLVGYSVTNTNVNVTTRVVSEIAAGATEIEVEDASEFLASGDFKYQQYWISYGYKDGNILKNVSGIGNLKIAIGDQISQSYVKENIKQIPDVWLNENERYGNLTTPAQTWFKVRHDQYGYTRVGYEARKTMVDTLNNIFAREPVLDTRYEWREIFESYDLEPASNKYDFHVSSLEERNLHLSRDQIEIGQTVLVDGIETTYGFWTLWKYDPTAFTTVDNGFVMIDAQKWRLQDGELWEAADWYADGWSSDDYPVRYFETISDRDHARDVDVTLFNGTLARVARLSETDRRWSWSVFTDSGWKEVAREKATIKLSSKFYDLDTVVYGFGDYDLSMINRRDGSWEIKIILDRLWTKVLTRLERNEMFFSMVKTAISQHDKVDWVFKTSFMYVSGFEEELVQSPIALPDLSEKILAYIDDVKPYHVKVRDFARRFRVPMETANITVTDFDKPMWYDEKLGSWRKLDINNADDELILKNDKHLHWWYDNYKKTNYSLNNWNEDFNPVRRPEITIAFDRVSCEPLIGWDVPQVPWDASESRWRKDVYYPSMGELIALYRNEPDSKYRYLTVRNSIERDQSIIDNANSINAGTGELFRTGDVVTQTDDSRTYMWSGTNWIEFWSSGWDHNYAGGAADRVEEYYAPGYGMRAKDLSILFKGCSFGGTEVNGGNNAYGLWDVFEWDHAAGWDNEYSHYVGFDVSLNDDDTTFRKADGVADITIDGGDLAQPWFAKGNPEELGRVMVKDPLSIKVFKQPTVDGTWPTNIPTTYHFVKNAFDDWRLSYLQENDITLAATLLSDDTTVKIMQPGGLTLHDPNTTNTAYLESIKNKVWLVFEVDLSNGMTAAEVRNRPDLMLTGVGEIIATNADTDDVADIVGPYLLEYLAKSIKGEIWLGSEKIVYGGIDYSEAANGIYTLTGVQRGSDGTSRKAINNIGERIYDGSILNKFQTYNQSNFRPSSVTEYTSLWTMWTQTAEAEGIPGPQ